MLGNRNFYRTFVILKPLDKNFGIKSGREPTGYCKFEVRKNHGKMEVYVQDLKPVDTDKGGYFTILASNIRGIKPLKLVPIDVDKEGRGKASLSFNPDSIQNSGHSLDKFHGIAVAFKEHGKAEYKYPLIGYSNKRIELDWHGGIARHLEDTYRPAHQTAEEPEGAEKFAREDVIDTNINKAGAVDFEKAEEVASEVCDSTTEDVGSENLEENEGLMEESREEVNKEQGAELESEPGDEPEENLTDYVSLGDNKVGTQEYAIDLTDEEITGCDMDLHGAFDAGYIDTSRYEDVFNEEYEDALNAGPFYDFQNFTHQDSEASKERLNAQGSEGETYWDKVKDYYLGLFKKHKKVCPFDDPVGEVDWIRIEHICDNTYPYYPGPAYGYRSTGSYLDHYLVGLAREKGKVRYVIYGIPGTYSSVPPMSMHGFSRWLPLKNGYGEGYWLLYIDCNTGQIAYPY